MKRIFNTGILLIGILAMSSCGRDYETVDAAFEDTVTILGVPNEVLQRKDPANRVDTKSSEAEEVVSDDQNNATDVAPKDSIDTSQNNTTGQ